MKAACPLCGSSDLFVFVERRDVPVHQNVPHATQQEAVAAPRGDLRIACCRRCSFATNTAFDPAVIEYGAGYENDQTHSELFDAHVDALVERLVALGARDCEVIEIGCGQGAFLTRLCERGGNRGVGFDPAYVGPESAARTRFVRSHFGPDAGANADLAICRHVIEHVPRPLELLRAVSLGLEHSPHARVAFETPDLLWILENVVTQDFFYEHCSYFTAATLTQAFALAGFKATGISHLFGGQYLWLEATRSPESWAHDGPAAVEATLRACMTYRAKEAERIDRLSQRLHELRKQGPVGVWGAGAKGVTFLNLLDPMGDRIDCVVDINPKKQGKYVPGTGHRIVAPEVAVRRGVRNVVVVNPNYLNEVRSQVLQAGLTLGVEVEAGA